MKKIILYLFLCVIFINTTQASATCYNINYNGKFGTRDSTYSNNISVIQAFLREYKFLVPGPSGYFGPSTLAAVKRFQATYGIVPVSGFVGNLTRAKIKSVSCSGDPYNPIQNPIYNEPSTGNSVRYMQNSLSSQNIYDGNNIIYKYKITAPDNASVSIPDETMSFTQSGVRTSGIKIQASSNDYFDYGITESSSIYDSVLDSTNYVSRNLKFSFYPAIVIPAGQTRYFQVVQNVSSRVTNGNVTISHPRMGSERLTVNSSSGGSGVTVTSLNSGEALTKNSSYTIKWSTTDIDNNKTIDISLVNTDGTSYPITTVYGSYAGYGEYSWTIPSTIPAKSGYQIRVSTGSARDVTDLTFTIKESAPSITVTAPTSSDIWNLDSTQSRTISWTYTGMESSRVATVYLLFPDNTRCIIGTATLGISTISGSLRSNSCIGVVKPITPGIYKIGVSAVTTSGVTILDYMDNSFTLTSDAVDPSLMKVLTPNGGESLVVTQSTNITWTTPSSVTATDLVNINLDVYTNTGTAPYKTFKIGSNANSKSYTWTIPSSLSTVPYVNSDRYKINVTSQKNTSLQDSSDTYFTIDTLQRVVTLTAPTQTSIARDTDFTVSWSKTGFLSTDKLNISIVPVGGTTNTLLKSNVLVQDGSAVVRIPLTMPLNSYRIKLTPVSYTFGSASLTTGSIFALTNKIGYSITPNTIASTIYKGDYVTTGWSSSGLTSTNMTIRLLTSTGSPIAGISSVSAPVSSGQKDVLIPATLPTGTYKISFESISDGTTVTVYSNTFTVTDPVYTFTLNSSPSSAVRNSNVDIGWSSTRAKTGDTVSLKIVDSSGNTITKNSTIGAQEVSINIPNIFVAGTATLYATTTAVGYTRPAITSSRTINITNPVLPSITVVSPAANSTSTALIQASWQNNNFASAVSTITSLKVYVIQKKGSITNSAVIESGLPPTTTSLAIPVASNGALGTLRNVGIDNAYDYQIKVEALAGSSVATSSVTVGTFKVTK